MFRGTMFKNGVKDLKSDFNFFQNAKHFAHLKKDVKIHSGFSGELTYHLLVIDCEKVWYTSPAYT